MSNDESCTHVNNLLICSDLISNDGWKFDAHCQQKMY